SLVSSSPNSSNKATDSFTEQLISMFSSYLSPGSTSASTARRILPVGGQLVVTRQISDASPSAPGPATPTPVVATASAPAASAAPPRGVRVQQSAILTNVSTRASTPAPAPTTPIVAVTPAATPAANSKLPLDKPPATLASGKPVLNSADA